MQKSFFKTTKFKISFLVGVSAFIVIIIFVFVNFNFITYWQNYSAKLAYKYPRQETLKFWSFLTRSDLYREYLVEEGIPNSVIQYSLKNEPQNTYITIKYVSEYATVNHINLRINNVTQYKYEYYNQIDFQVITTQLQNLSDKFTYSYNGTNGKSVFEKELIDLYDNGTTQSKVLSDKYISQVNPVNEKVFIGTQTSDDYVTQARALGQSLVDNLAAKNVDKFTDLLLDEKNYGIESVSEAKLSSLYILNISIPESQSFKFTNEKNFKVSTATFFLGNCAKEANVDIFYDIDLKTYKFGDPTTLLNSLCEKQIERTIEVAKCTDCTLYPVDKWHALPSFYAPSEFQDLSSVGSSYQLSKNAYNDFIELYNAANAEGFNISINSAYRSYDNQVETFNYWKQQELAAGADDATAEANANTYSAKPGFSEHQLGTTLDLTALECATFVDTCPQNEAFWAWLSNNAYKYGFVMSYPTGREDETGYVPEAWHYRWLGKELAAQYQSQIGKLTLNEWLLEKHLY